MVKILLQCRRPGFDPWLGKIPWRREWLPTPVFLPGELDRQRSLVVYSPWSHKSNTTEQLTLSFSSYLILLCFTDTELLLLLLLFNQLKVSGNPPLIKSQGIIFSTAFTQFVSGSHFGNSHNISNFSIVIIFGMVICGFWYYYYNLLKHPMMMNNFKQ